MGCGGEEFVTVNSVGRLEGEGVEEVRAQKATDVEKIYFEL